MSNQEQEQEQEQEERFKHKEQTLLDEYIATLSVIELKALKIAQKQLESSFNLEKSVGFLDYIDKRTL